MYIVGEWRSAKAAKGTLSYGCGAIARLGPGSPRTPADALPAAARRRRLTGDLHLSKRIFLVCCAR
jgi:hypothetical protein